MKNQSTRRTDHIVVGKKDGKGGNSGASADLELGFLGGASGLSGPVAVGSSHQVVDMADFWKFSSALSGLARWICTTHVGAQDRSVEDKEISPIQANLIHLVVVVIAITFFFMVFPCPCFPIPGLFLSLFCLRLS